jgi:hypothetical protein
MAQQCVDEMNTIGVPSLVKRNFKDEGNYKRFIEDTQKREGKLKECTNEMYKEVYGIVSGQSPAQNISTNSISSTKTAKDCVDAMNKAGVPSLVKKNFKDIENYKRFINKYTK